MPFVKLDCGIIHSSLWAEDSDTKICWITLLLLADATGFVRAAASAIAREAGIPAEVARRALDLFQSADDESRTPDNEGKRIEKVDGGYHVLNYEKYRERDYTAALRQKRFREKHKNNSVTHVTKRVMSRRVTHAEAEAEAEADKKKRRPLSLAELVDYAKTRGITRSDAEAFYDSMEAGGWTRNGKALKDWQAHLRSYKSNGYLASQRQRKNGAHPDNPRAVDKSKIEVPERFKAWIAERYPAKREEAMKWQTWADVPSNGLRDQWWREEKSKLPIGDML